MSATRKQRREQRLAEVQRYGGIYSMKREPRLSTVANQTGRAFKGLRKVWVR